MASRYSKENDDSDLERDVPSTVDGLTYYDPDRLSSDDATGRNFGPRSVFQAAADRLAASRLRDIRSEEDEEDEEDKVHVHISDHQPLALPSVNEPARNPNWPPPPPPPIPNNAIKRYKLAANDVQLLRLVTDAADRKIRSSRMNSPTKDEHDSSLNEADFAELFQTFKAFTARNGITPESTPAYFHCLNVIVHLCSYTQSTWRERFNQLFRDYSLAESLRIKQQDLEKRLRNFQLYTRARIIETWYNKYVVQSMYDRNLMTVAITRDRQLLKRDSLRLWMYTFGVEQWRLTSAEIRHERKLLFNSFKKLYHKSVTIMEDNNFARQFVLAKFVTKWKSRYTHYTSKLSNSAVIHYNSNLKYRVFGDWTYKYYDEIAQSHSNGLLVIKLFGKWKEKTARLVNININVERRAERTISRNVLRRWSTSLQVRNDDTKFAVSVHNAQMKKNAFDLWRKYTHLFILSEPLVELSACSIRHSVFQGWLLKTLQSLEAKRFRDFMLCHRILSQWRLRTGTVTIVKAIDFNIVKDRFHRWLLSERLELMVRYRDNAIALKVLKIWFVKSRKSSRHQWALTKEAISYDCSHIQMKYLYTWQLKLKQKRENEGKAIHLQKQWQLQQFFSTYFTAVYRVADNYLLACKMHDKLTLQHAFSFWRAVTYQKMQKRLAVIYRDIKKNFRKERLRSAFKYWRTRHIQNGENESQADLIVEARNALLLTNFFYDWNSQLTHLGTEYDRACYTYDDNLLAIVIGRWKTKNAKILQDIDIAGLREINKNISLLGKILRNWSYAVSEIRRDINFADEILHKRQKSRFGRIWKLWRAKLSDVSLKRQLEFEEANKTIQLGDGSPKSRLSQPNQQAQPPRTIARIPQELSPSTSRTVLRPLVPTQSRTSLPITKKYDTTLLETPSRARAKGFNVPLTSVEQWRKMKSSSKLRTEILYSDEPNDNDSNE